MFASIGSRVRSPSKTDRRRGFTLLEVLVAFAVLAVALGVAFEIFSTGLRGARSSDALTRAVLIAESRLALVGTEIELKLGETRGETDDGVRWRVDIRERTPPEGDDERVVTPSLPVLREVVVTVSWDDAAGERTFELRTARLAPGEFD